MPRLSKGKKRLQKVKKTVRRGRSARRVRTASGICDDMSDRIAKHDILKRDHNDDGPLRERIVDNFIEETVINEINEIKDLLMTAIHDFASDSQSYSTSDSFYCGQTITPIKLLKTKFNELSNEITVDKLLKNTFNSL